MKSTYKFSQADVGPAFEMWSKDFNGESVTKAELEYGCLVFAAERYTYSHAGVWPNLKELESWTVANTEKSDQVTEWPTCAQERNAK